MIREFEVENFYSIADRQRCSFRATAKYRNKAGFVPSQKKEDAITTCMAIIGPNASGKSNLLNAITFTIEFLYNSWLYEDEKIPLIAPFAFSKEWKNKPSSFLIETEDITTGYLFRYELTALPIHVVNEALFVKSPKGRWSCALSRERDTSLKTGYAHYSECITYKKDKIKIDIKDEDLLDSASLVSIFRRKKNPLVLDFLQTISSQYNKTQKNSTLVNLENKDTIPKHLTLESILESEKKKNFILNFLQKLDNTIVDIVFKDLYEELRATKKKLLEVLVKAKRIESEEIRLLREKVEKDIEKYPVDDDKTAFRPYIRYTVDGKIYDLSLSDESDGITSLIHTLIVAYTSLSDGSLLVCDEIDSSLHPIVVGALVGLFLDPASNPGKGQIICTTHNVNLIKSLNAFQVLLVEKQKLKESTIWRLGDMDGLRQEENYVTNYLAGTYGAIPLMNR